MKTDCTCCKQPLVTIQFDVGRKTFYRIPEEVLFDDDGNPWCDQCVSNLKDEQNESR